eukprot:CAMPEP_0113650726 /NCGR_PEP_ID=MMETSP0017_2-20120614/27013_1 /TAXON_ID=2856 /ORGANISM="Cylindrotheca closterium" /LENGTH=568 /DNA_ID=CAMNT_0000563299 /DNA_START=174 /DNA_END=1880 /DNA_ORIENTATION=- /assembly_acc=CAM_ASM_000147
MRVLLPLRKVASDSQVSNSDHLELEDTARQEIDLAVQVSSTNVLPEASKQPSFRKEQITVPTFDTREHQLEQQAQQKASILEAKRLAIDLPKETRPLQTTEGSIVTGSKKLVVPSFHERSFQKRKTSHPEVDAKVSRKRPALDRKPAAKETMVAPGRNSNWSYHRNHGDREDSTERNDSNGLLVNRHSPRLNDDLPSTPEADVDFEVLLKKQGLEIREQAGDGNCLFRAVSLQVYGDPSMHMDVRKQCMDHMERDKEHFSQFVTGEPFDAYVERKRQEGVHGNNPEIQAISELFNRPVEVFCPENGASPLNIFHAEYKTGNAPIRLSYHDGNHYNAVVDPLVPTAGLGLGLPGLQPGLADKLQMSKAVAESDAIADQMQYEKALKDSEEDEVQRAIKESQLSAEHRSSHEALAQSDMDATYFDLEQAALERSLQSYISFEHEKKQCASNNTRQGSADQESSPNNATSATATIRDASPLEASMPTSSAVASLPTASASSPPVAAAASMPSAAASDDHFVSPPSASMDVYPQTVQELVMNGFELQKVIRAYELVGDNFDELLTFLVSNSR